ncbi:hypothetical protein FA13DRAFT_1743101 [Coprinellus micaceus]|uniref:Uncharacterized protein n=1 Tax=Coprinellus micaceus TaxID=71717 RepID=A0A4Y7SFT8_COPMI|nr:hypothetical protein FA13DRAFT_1743101 [Coprinellus micaceus]
MTYTPLFVVPCSGALHANKCLVEPQHLGNDRGHRVSAYRGPNIYKPVNERSMKEL